MNKLRRKSIAYDESIEKKDFKLPVFGVKCNESKVNKFLTDRIHKVRVNMEVEKN